MIKIRFKQETVHKLWFYPLASAWGSTVVLFFIFLIEWAEFGRPHERITIAQDWIGIPAEYLMIVCALIFFSPWIPEWCRDRKREIKNWWNSHYDEKEGVLEL